MLSLRYVVFAVAIPTVIGVGAMVVLSGIIWNLAPVYAAKATVVFGPKASRSGAIPGPDSVVLVANNSLTFVTAPETLTEVARRTGVPVQEVESAVDATIIPGTATVSIDAEMESPTLAAEVVNDLAEQLAAAVEDSPAAAVGGLNRAIPNQEPSGPPRTLLTGVAALFSVVLALLAFGVVVGLLRLSQAGGLRAQVGRWLAPRTQVTGSSPGDDSKNLTAVARSPIAKRHVTVDEE